MVLTDVEMPGMTGIELLGRLREIAPQLPVAVLTAHPCGWTTRSRRCGTAPTSSWRTSVEPDRLVAVVASLVAKGQAIREASRQSVLAIGAHPDDVEIGARAGAFARAPPDGP